MLVRRLASIASGLVQLNAFGMDLDQHGCGQLAQSSSPCLMLHELSARSTLPQHWPWDVFLSRAVGQSLLLDSRAGGLAPSRGSPTPLRPRTCPGCLSCADARGSEAPTLRPCSSSQTCRRPGHQTAGNTWERATETVRGARVSRWHQKLRAMYILPVSSAEATTSGANLQESQVGRIHRWRSRMVCPR